MEIDAYPANASEWEATHGLEASEEVNAHFGYLSAFHETHGYYIDGVDASTAALPPNWRERQILTPVDCDGREAYAITPEIHDLAASKLCRFDVSDRAFVEALHAGGHLDPPLLEARIRTVPASEEEKARAAAFVRSLAKR